MRKLMESILVVGMLFCGSAIDGAVEKPESFAVYVLMFGVTMAAAWAIAHERHA